MEEGKGAREMGDSGWLAGWLLVMTLANAVADVGVLFSQCVLQVGYSRLLLMMVCFYSYYS